MLLLLLLLEVVPLAMAIPSRARPLEPRTLLFTVLVLLAFVVVFILVITFPATIRLLRAVAMLEPIRNMWAPHRLLRAILVMLLPPRLLPTTMPPARASREPSVMATLASKAMALLVIVSDRVACNELMLSLVPPIMASAVRSHRQLVSDVEDSMSWSLTALAVTLRL